MLGYFQALYEISYSKVSHVYRRALATLTSERRPHL
jgi:hypothetical protein